MRKKVKAIVTIALLLAIAVTFTVIGDRKRIHAEGVMWVEMLKLEWLARDNPFGANLNCHHTRQEPRRSYGFYMTCSTEPTNSFRAEDEWSRESETLLRSDIYDNPMEETRLAEGVRRIWIRELVRHSPTTPHRHEHDYRLPSGKS